MKKLLDPVANAKTIGYLSIIFGIPGVLENFSLLSKGISLVVLYSLLISIFNIIVGFGLIKTKKWGLYGLLLLTGVSILNLLYLLTTKPQVSVLVIMIVTVIFSLLISTWLYRAKDRFI